MANLDIDRLILGGLSNNEISEQLHISVNTIKSRRRNLKAKLQDGRMCLYCGAIFSEAKCGRHKNFCSSKCRSDYWNKKKKQKEYKNICENCGCSFKSIGNPNKRFCSRKCYCDYERRIDYS